SANEYELAPAYLGKGSQPGRRAIGMGADRRADDGRHIDALEVEIGERASEYGDPVGGSQPFLHEHDVAAADSAQAPARSATRRDAERVPLEAVVTDLDAETPSDV